MNWVKAFAIAVLNAIVGLFGAGTIAALCVDWYRVPSREGAAGFFIICLALLGLIVGFFIGAVAGLVLLLKRKTGFFPALALTTGGTLVLLGLITGVAYLAADLPPKIDGKELVLEFEVRVPAWFEQPNVAEGERAHVYVTRDHGDRASQGGELRFNEARAENGHLIVPATVFLHTSDPGKSLSISIGDRPVQYYNLPVPGRPARRDMEWSEWIPGPTFGEVDKIPPEERLAVRYRVQFYVAPPERPQLSREEAEAQALAADEAALAALPPGAPISEWLRFTDYTKAQSVRERAAEAIAQRPNVPAELSAQFRSDDREVSDRALRAVALMKTLPTGLTAAVEEVGREILEEIHVVNATTVEEDPGYERAAALSLRFSGWHEAARVLHGHDGADFLPVMREILEAARVREDSIGMRDVVRVAEYYANKWSADARL